MAVTVAVALLAVFFASVAWHLHTRRSRTKRLRGIVDGIPAAFAGSASPKRILVLSGALHKTGGATAEIVASLREHVDRLVNSKSTDGRPLVEVRVVYANDLGLAHCKGCASCVTRDVAQCPIYRSDAFGTFYENELLRCDALVLVSPVYVGGCTGEMKKCLDRLAFAFHRPPLAGVPSLAISTAAAWWHKETAKFLEVATEHMGCTSVGRLGFTSMSSAASRDRKIGDATTALLAHIAMAKREYVPTWGQVWVYAIHKTGCRYLAVDEAYWRARGWVRDGTSSPLYFFDCNMSLPKRLFSWAIIALFTALQKHGQKGTNPPPVATSSPSPSPSPPPFAPNETSSHQ